MNSNLYIGRRKGQKEKNHTLLSIAIWNQDYKTAEYFIKSGADVNARISFRVSSKMFCEYVLHLAAIRAPTSLVELLLDYNANIDAQAKDGTTAIKIANTHRNMDVFKLLFNRGANYYPCHLVTEEYNSFLDAYNDLIHSYEFKMDIKSVINRQKTILFLVMKLDPQNNELIQTLLDAGFNMNSVNWDNKLAVDIRPYHEGKYINYPDIKIHIIKLMSAGFVVRAGNLLAVKGKEFDSCRLKCRSELQVTKTNNLNEGNIPLVTFFDILVMKNLHYFAVRFKHVELDPIVDKEKLCKDYPLYGAMLFYRLREVSRRIKLIRKVEKSIENELCPLGLPYDFVRALWWYFSNDELKKCCGMTKYFY